MKCNLKNIPKLGNYPDEGTSKQEFIDYTERVVEWFERFEKQESKRHSNAQIELERASSSDARHCGYLAGYIVAKKEILGE